MATLRASYAQYAATLAAFKLWAQSISTAFSTFGWAQSSDSGQVNWSTISSVPASTSPAYEIWTMGDSLQSSTPVYVLMQYAGSSAGPYLAATLGSGSTGAGALTGAGTKVVLCNLVGSSATAVDCLYSGGTSRIGVLMWRTNTASCFFSIERSHSSTGADQAGYATLAAAAASTAGSGARTQQTVYPAASGGPLAQIAGLAVLGDSKVSNVVNFTVPVTLVRPFVGYLDNPLNSVLAIKSACMPDGGQFSATVSGLTHNYFLANKAMLSGGKILSTSTYLANYALAMRYD